MKHIVLGLFDYINDLLHDTFCNDYTYLSGNVRHYINQRKIGEMVKRERGLL